MQFGVGLNQGEKCRVPVTHLSEGREGRSIERAPRKFGAASSHTAGTAQDGPDASRGP